MCFYTRIHCRGYHLSLIRNVSSSLETYLVLLCSHPLSPRENSFAGILHHGLVLPTLGVHTHGFAQAALFGSGFFPPAWDAGDVSLLSVVHVSLLLSSIPLYRCSSLFLHFPGNRHLACFHSWLTWRKLLWAFSHKSPCRLVFSFLWVNNS